jgi:hypothetical protein
MGKGGAQLGKAVKGKDPEQAKQNADTKQNAAAEKPALLRVDEELARLQEYERLAQLAEATRRRLKVCAPPVFYEAKVQN